MTRTNENWGKGRENRGEMKKGGETNVK